MFIDVKVFFYLNFSLFNVSLQIGVLLNNLILGFQIYLCQKY